jgi:hypothetical protein
LAHSLQQAGSVSQVLCPVAKRDQDVGIEVKMTLFWVIVPLLCLAFLLWCCLAISGDIAEMEEHDQGIRRS